jgi:hypothetical protein
MFGETFFFTLANILPEIGFILGSLSTSYLLDNYNSSWAMALGLAVVTLGFLASLLITKDYHSERGAALATGEAG